MKKKITNWLIPIGISILIFLFGIFKQRISLSLGIIIGLWLGLVNSHLSLRTTFRGLEFETRSKAQRYYFFTNLLKYSLIVLIVYLIMISKKISVYGLLFGLILSILFILAGFHSGIKLKNDE